MVIIKLLSENELRKYEFTLDHIQINNVFSDNTVDFFKTEMDKNGNFFFIKDTKSAYKIIPRLFSRNEVISFL